jgi:hypothetical protein
MRKLTVVGEENEALGVGVKPTDMEEPFRARVDEFRQRSSTLRVVHCADHPAGLVQRQVNQSGDRWNPLAIDPNHGLARVDPHALTHHPVAVDLHAPLGYQFLTSASTAEASHRQHLLQPDSLFVPPTLVFLRRQGYISG